MGREKEIDNGRKLSGVSYMVGGCLGYCMEKLVKQLDVVNVRLSGEEKMLVKGLKSELCEVESNVSSLEGLGFKVMGRDEDGKVGYEDGRDIYWGGFLGLVDRGGSDKLWELRLMGLVDKIRMYKCVVNLGGMKVCYEMGFGEVSKGIRKGEFSKEEFKKVLEVYEEGSEKSKG